MANQVEVKVAGCFNCPFWSIRYFSLTDSCLHPNVRFEHRNDIDFSFKEQKPITPHWCPLKETQVVIKFE
jgi:hypothetical protein